MYLNDTIHVEVQQRNVLTNQLIGWIYESHLWHITGKDETYPMTCKWCGATSPKDLEVEGDPAVCKKNPLIISLLNNIEEKGEN